MKEAVAAVVGMLAAGGVADVFRTPPSALLCAEPTVVSFSGWERLARPPEGGERGRAAVTVRCVRETDAAAEDAARACEAAVREAGRAAWNEDGAGVRIVAVDAQAPRREGVDGSGRTVWAVDVMLTMTRDF